MEDQLRFWVCAASVALAIATIQGLNALINWLADSQKREFRREFEHEPIPNDCPVSCLFETSRAHVIRTISIWTSVHKDLGDAQDNTRHSLVGSGLTESQQKQITNALDAGAAQLRRRIARLHYLAKHFGYEIGPLPQEEENAQPTQASIG